MVESASQGIELEAADGDSVVDTGKVTSATSSRTVAGGTLTNGVSYRWRVRTWDALDTQGPWSNYGTFSTSSGGTVTITDPATDNPAGVITDDILVTWVATGTTPAKVRARLYRNDTGAMIGDSGWQTYAGSNQNYISGMVSDVEHTITIQVENAALLQSGIGSRLVTPSYGTPEVPLITVTPIPDGGYVLIAVENPPPAGDRPDVTTNRVLRRRGGSSDSWEVLGECDPGGSFRDYTAPSWTPMEYMVRGESA